MEIEDYVHAVQAPATPPTVQHNAEPQPQIEPARVALAAAPVQVEHVFPYVAERDGHLEFEQFFYGPFVIRNEDLPVLNDNPINEAGVGAIFARVPVWEPAPSPVNQPFLTTIRLNGTSPAVLERGAYIASGTYGVTFDAVFTDRNNRRFDGCVMKIMECSDFISKRQSILEMCIQAIVSHTCTYDPYIAQRQQNGRMTKTPIMLAAFVVHAPSYRKEDNQYFATDERRIPYVVCVMEKVGTTTWHRFLSSEQELTVHARSTAIAFSMYQIASLFDRLGELIEFNHRDCHAGNVTIRYDEGSAHYCSTIAMFQTCLIDFGLSRVTFRGRTFLAGSDLFLPENTEQNYKNGMDVVLFAWSVRNSLGCRTDVDVPCDTLMLSSLNTVLRTVMISTGINFQTFLHASTSRALYKALSFAGEDENLRRVFCDYTYNGRVVRYTMHTRAPSNPRLFSNRFVKQSTAIVLRICTWWCHPTTRGLTDAERQDGIRPLENELRALIDRDQTVEPNDDEVRLHATM